VADARVIMRAFGGYRITDHGASLILILRTWAP
jgi:hypothetical protein